MENFWIFLMIIAIIALVIIAWHVVKSLKNIENPDLFRYVFIHPAGLDYMKQKHLEPKSFVILEDEDLLYVASKQAKEFALKHPYWRVTVTDLPRDRYSEVKEWESCTTYFSIYD